MLGYPIFQATGLWSIHSIVSMTQILAWKLIFFRKVNWIIWRKILGVRLRSTNLSPHKSTGLNPGCSGGRHRWWPLHQPTVHCNSLINMRVSKTSLLWLIHIKFCLMCSKANNHPVSCAFKVLGFLHWGQYFGGMLFAGNYYSTFTIPRSPSVTCQLT